MILLSTCLRWRGHITGPQSRKLNRYTAKGNRYAHQYITRSTKKSGVETQNPPRRLQKSMEKKLYRQVILIRLLKNTINISA